jgi:Ca2+-binding EF-hand superfamily protein
MTLLKNHTRRLIVTHRILLTAFLSTAAVAASAQNTTAPVQGAQSLTRTTFMQKIDSTFVNVDGNKDGFMDRAEIETAETKAMAARKAAVIREREAAFRALDANKDGNLSLQEFNARVAATALPKANATPILNRLDTNKDGKVSLAENRVPSMAQFDRADTNKDGALSPAEQRAAAKR